MTPEVVQTTSSPFLVDVSKSLIGTFVGALLAFGTAMLVQLLQRRREHRAAGNVAVVTLRAIVDDFLNFRRGFLESMEESHTHIADAPNWFVARPIQYAFSDNFNFDYSALAFLAEKSVDTLVKLSVVERRYRDLAAIVKDYNDAAQNKQLVMSSWLANPANVGNYANAERHAGLEVIGRVNSLVDAILDRLAQDDADYDAAVSSLNSVLNKRFNGKGVSKISPIEIKWRLAPFVRVYTDPKYQPVSFARLARPAIGGAELPNVKRHE